MRLAIGAGFLAAIGLFAFGPASAAYATVDSPSPSPPLVSEEPPEESSAPEMLCEITDETDNNDLTIEVQSSEDFETIIVTVDDEEVDPKEVEGNSITISRPDTDGRIRFEGQDSEGEQRADCTVDFHDDTQPESEITDEPEPTADPEPTETEPTPTDSSSTPTPTPTTPEPTETPVPTQPAPPSPDTVTPTQPSSPTITSSTPAAPQQPITSAPPTPYAPPVTSAPPPSSTATTSPSEDLNGADTERRGPREIRPLAESPRYLLPEIFGMQSHRGSPLVMPGPLDADERASELETLPPISEDELDAIKAQLSSPGHADRTPTGSHVESAAPQEPTAGQGSWWLLGGLTSAVGIGAVLWWALKRYRRNH